MKTAISLPDSLFRSANGLARRLGMSRSRLFATAVAEFIAKHREDKVAERLNDVYATGTSRMDPPLTRAQKRVLSPGEW
jgi:metal-responsive CopG/Arc/MetJ family transcriptional regulator